MKGTYDTLLLALRGILSIGAAALLYSVPDSLPVAVMNHCVRSVVEEKGHKARNLNVPNQNEKP